MIYQKSPYVYNAATHPFASNSQHILTRP